MDVFPFLPPSEFLSRLTITWREDREEDRQMDRHTDDRQTDKVITDASSLLQHRLMVLSPDGSQKCGSLGNGIPPCPISSASDPL